MSATPIATRTMALETKYGKIMRTRPQISGTTAFCLLPYKKKPSPAELNSKPQKSSGALNGVLPGDQADAVSKRSADMPLGASLEANARVKCHRAADLMATAARSFNS